mgnify:CR=1 FL=1
MSKILIVEDEEAIADLERDYLELSGFTVEVANDGDIGLQKALNEDYDLLILDLMLPGTDGFDICRQVRDVKNTPIVMVSAKKDDIDKIRGLGLGADDYMTKPFLPRELILRISAILRRTYQLDEKNSSIFRLGKREVDLSAGIVRVMDESGKTIQLTNKEYQLLKLFLENRGRILTFDVLSESVWGENYYDYENTLMVHIRRLREKIEEKPSEPAFLITVKGLGYRMNA